VNRLALAAIVVVAAACGNGGGARDKLLAAWKSAGLAPSAFAPAKDSPVGKDCSLGTVSNVDVLICTFTTADEARAAQDAGLKWVGDATGIATPKGTLLIVAADRKKADPKGTTINKLVKTAP
jgi:hypothetical protein